MDSATAVELLFAGKALPVPMDVLWIKRDVRVGDNEALSRSASSSSNLRPLLLLYVYEDVHMQSETYHESHHKFINEGLAEMDKNIRAISWCGRGITFRRGHTVVDVLRELHENEAPIKTLYCHREVGNGISLSRDQDVYGFAHENRISLVEFSQDGVAPRRGLSFDERKKAFQKAIANSVQMTPPSRISLVQNIPCGKIMNAQECGVKHMGLRPEASIGGETIAHETLNSFLAERGRDFFFQVSSPLGGWTSCSKLSPYLTWGHISLRQVYQAAAAKKKQHIESEKANGSVPLEISSDCDADDLEDENEEEEAANGKKGKTSRKKGENMSDGRKWTLTLQNFLSRLYWRSKFMQQLHDDPSIEYRAKLEVYDTLRDSWHQGRYDVFLRDNVL